jgi:general secretion pathway protein B
MSFILDALKKSETERQRNAGPALAEAPRSHRAPARPWWVFALGALLLVNLIVFAVVLLRGQHTTNAVPPTTPPITAVAPASVPAPVAVAPAPVVATPAPAPAPATVAPVASASPAAPASMPRSETSLADEAAISAPTAAEQANLDPSLAAASAVPGGPPIVRSLNQNSGFQPPPGQNTNNQYARNQPAPATDERLPSINELTGSAAMHLPDLRMDLHVFANNPAGRFVSINGRKYVEGQKLNEGPTLESITRDGVVLNNQGMRFVLPRPQ